MIKDSGGLSLWDETWLRTWVPMMGIKASNFIEYCSWFGCSSWHLESFFFYSLQNMGNCPICNVCHMLVSLLICTKDPQDAYFISVIEPRFRLPTALFRDQVEHSSNSFFFFFSSLFFSFFWGSLDFWHLFNSNEHLRRDGLTKKGIF